MANFPFVFCPKERAGLVFAGAEETRKWICSSGTAPFDAREREAGNDKEICGIQFQCWWKTSLAF